MEILRRKYHNCLTLNKYSNTFYTIDFSNVSTGLTLMTATNLKSILYKWNDLLNIICELVELDMDYSKEKIQEELKRIHRKLDIDFDTLYSIRKEFV